jgi:glutaredoxin-like protein NrdH
LQQYAKLYSKQGDTLFDYLDFSDVPGDKGGHDLKLFALSTCGFCRRAIAFLNDRKVGYSFVYVDQLPIEVKKKAKEEFSARFRTRMLYPTLLIDEKDTLIGFIEESWKKSLGLE